MKAIMAYRILKNEMHPIDMYFVQRSYLYVHIAEDNKPVHIDGMAIPHDALSYYYWASSRGHYVNLNCKVTIPSSPLQPKYVLHLKKRRRARYDYFFFLVVYKTKKNCASYLWFSKYFSIISWHLKSQKIDINPVLVSVSLLQINTYSRFVTDSVSFLFFFFRCKEIQSMYVEYHSSWATWNRRVSIS